VSTSVVNWSEGLSNWVSINIIRYIRSFMAVSFITFFPYSSVSTFYYCLYGCMLCTLLFNFVNYVFLLLCYVFFC
jgi:hypothetical protein